MQEDIKKTKAPHGHMIVDKTPVIMGLWMLRSGVFEEIREIWNRKWVKY